MDLDTVGGLVAALITTYNDALEFYTHWQQMIREENHYAIYASSGQSYNRCCGLSISLSSAMPRIREAFDSGADVLGAGFSVGDGK